MTVIATFPFLTKIKRSAWRNFERDTKPTAQQQINQQLVDRADYLKFHSQSHVARFKRAFHGLWAEAAFHLMRHKKIIWKASSSRAVLKREITQWQWNYSKDCWREIYICVHPCRNFRQHPKNEWSSSVGANKSRCAIREINFAILTRFLWLFVHNKLDLPLPSLPLWKKLPWLPKAQS